MKKIVFLFVFLFTSAMIYAQGFGAGISGGYLTELDGFGGSADLIYEFDEHWGVSTTFTFAVSEEGSLRNKWTALDLNARYKVFDELYLLAGGEYLSITLKDNGLGGGSIGGSFEVSDSEFGVNVGAGYKYNIVDNVNIFAEVKYVAVETGYIHSRLGLLFDF